MAVPTDREPAATPLPAPEHLPPLVLLVAGPRARAEGRAGTAAVRAADRLARTDRTLVLVDLDPADGLLPAAVGNTAPEGLADLLLLHIPLQKLALPTSAPGVRFLPFGASGTDPDRFLAHPRWMQAVAEAERHGWTLLAFVAGNQEALPDLARHAGGAVLLGDSEEERRELRERLPEHLPLFALPATEHAGNEPAAPDAAAATVATARLHGVVENEDEPRADDLPGGPEWTVANWLEAEARLDRPEELPEPSPEEAAPPADREEVPPPGPARYIVPRSLPAQERFIRGAALLIVAYWTYYIVWRWTDTLNPDALWFSVPLALAESWGLLTAYFLVFTTWRLNHRTPPPPPEGVSVDVFITTYDEPLEVVRRTAISAREIRYPHRTFLLDDGRREEMRAMAEELGIEYLQREDNLHAKAGNLNHALRHTTGEFILQLDADHAPLPQFLDRTLGFFADPAVAFVQTPQDFYNIDSFTFEVSQDEQRIWEEQRLFFSVIQPGKDATNTAFFCGSCAVIRRSALDEIGGFSTKSITEDIETSLLLHAGGWKSVYYGESLAYGLAAGSAEAFHTQHMRWAQGAMQVLRRFNPLFYPGLSLAQRVGYFYSLTAYVNGLQKLVFYLAPILFFLTGALPVRALDGEFLIRFFPYLILTVLLLELLARGLGFTWITERYQMAKFWTYTRGLLAFFTRRPLPFKVTPKGPGRVHPATYAPHLTLMVLTAVSANWAAVAYAFGWVDYGVPGWRSLAFQLNFLWASLNFVLAAYVVRLSQRMQHQRQDHRFSDRFPIVLRTRGSKGRLGEPYLALTEDLNASGISFRSVHEFAAGTGVRLTLPLSTREVTVRGAIVHVRRDPEEQVSVFVHGVEFRDVPLDVRDAIELHCAQHSVPIRHMRFSHTSDVVGRAQGWIHNARGEPRRRVRLPTWVRVGSEAAQRSMAFLEELSPSGARLIMDEPVAPGTLILYEVPDTGMRGEGLAIFSRALETPIGVRFAVGVRRQTSGLQEPPSGRTMKLRRFWRTAATSACVLAALAGATGPARAQIQPVIFGTAEGDTEDFSLFLVGVAVQPEGNGLQPVGTLTAYRLTYPLGAGSNSLNALNPAVGLRNQWPTGAVQATVGYLLLSEEDVVGAFGAPGGTEEGVTTQLQGDYWGTGARTAQAIVSYNWGGEYLWSRARAAQRVARLGGGDLRLGIEAVAQGGRGQPIADENYHSAQIGPMLQFQPGAALQLIASGGIKTDNLEGPDRSDTFPWFKVEIVLVP